MNSLFLALMLLSLVGLVVGLISPKIFRTTRKTAGTSFAVAAIVFFILFGVTMSNAPTPVEATTSTTAASSSDQTAQAPAITPASAPVKTVTTAPAPTPAPAPHVPAVLLQISGNGTKSTQTFTAPSSWTLDYSYDCSGFSDGSGNFQVFIQNANGGFNGLSPVNQLGASGSDTEYYHSGGQLYLEINSECSWTVTAKG